MIPVIVGEMLAIHRFGRINTSFNHFPCIYLVKQGFLRVNLLWEMSTSLAVRPSILKSTLPSFGEWTD